MLNKSAGNMYSFVNYTWNTIKGTCPHDCSYCYMKRWGKLNPIRLDRKEFKTDLGSGNFIFVGSSCDMFADDILAEWIEETVAYCLKYDNKYLFQSKNPLRMGAFLPRDNQNIVVCTTIETNRWYSEIMNNCPSTRQRAKGLANLPFKRYVTIEPILDFDLDALVNLIRIANPEQVNIGADSGNNHLPEPTREKVDTLIAALKDFTVISKKTNLNRLQV